MLKCRIDRPDFDIIGLVELPYRAERDKFADLDGSKRYLTLLWYLNSVFLACLGDSYML